MKRNIRRATIFVLTMVFLFASVTVPGSAANPDDQIIKEYNELVNAIKPIDGVTVTCIDALGPHDCKFEIPAPEGFPYRIAHTCNVYEAVRYFNMHSDLLATGIQRTVKELEELDDLHMCSEDATDVFCTHSVYTSGCLNVHDGNGWCQRLIRCDYCGNYAEWVYSSCGWKV